MLPYGRTRIPALRCDWTPHRLYLRPDYAVLHQRTLSAGERDCRSVPDGSATNIISGISVGFETTGAAALTIAVALLSSYFVGERVQGIFPVDTGFFRSAGIYGTAVATMGMLMSAAYILAMDTFGPITDNAGGIVEMSNQPDSVRDTTDALDSAGNTTKALTKGYAIGTAALAAFLLFSAYLQEVKRFGGEAAANPGRRPCQPAGVRRWAIGAALVFVFASLAMRAVGKAASAMIEEVRRQFRTIPASWLARRRRTTRPASILRFAPRCAK